MNRKLLTAFAAAALLSATSLYAQDTAKKPVPKPLTPEIRKHITASLALAKGLPPVYMAEIYSQPYAQMMLPADQALVPKRVANMTVQPPTKLFDQLYYFGNGYVGAVVLVTNAGIIQWDSMDNAKEAKEIIEAGYKKMGLNPDNIKYLILTHGHSDHFGGAAYMKKAHPGLHVLASDADWKFMDYQVKKGTLQKDRDPPPAKDQSITDGEKITLGGSTVTLYITPGHTPGTVSSIIPVTDHGTPHVLAMFGGITIPMHLEPRQTDSGLEEYVRQWARFGAIAKKAGADGVISTHPGFDGLVTSIAKIQARKPGDPNPIILGKDGYARYVQADVEVSEADRGMIALSGGN